MKRWGTITIILFVFSMGCAATPGTLDTLRKYDPHLADTDIPLKNNESLVFGRVVVHMEGKAVKSCFADLSTDYHVIVGHSWEEYSSWLPVTNRNSKCFYSWRLPPGEYRVLSILPYAFAAAVYEPTPFRFTVPESGKA